MCAAVWLLGWAIILPVSIMAHLVSLRSPQHVTSICTPLRRGYNTYPTPGVWLLGWTTNCDMSYCQPGEPGGVLLEPYD